MAESALRFLADVNISPLTVSALQDGGWEATRVPSECSPDASDREILSHARRTNRIVLTQDLDFSALLALGGYAQPSLITLRLSDPGPNVVNRRLLAALPHVKEDVRSGAAVTITDENLRVRPLPIP